MRQIIDGQEVYVIEFDEVPELPIIWTFPDEEPYARALGAAIRAGQITEGGKYGIKIEPDDDPENESGKKYVLFRINEE